MRSYIAHENEPGTETVGCDIPDVSAIFGTDVLTAVSRVEADLNDLPARERACVAQACVSRQREFATGRLLARSLLARIGLVDAPVLVNDDRSPVWPPNVVGSISHAGDVCVVVLAPRGQIRALGVDLEHNQPLELELIDTICTSRERERLVHYPCSLRGFIARSIFSAKECAFKCQYPLTKTQLDYEDLEIELDMRYARFNTRFRRAAGWSFPRNAILYGKLCVFPTWIVSGITLRGNASHASR